ARVHSFPATDRRRRDHCRGGGPGLPRRPGKARRPPAPPARGGPEAADERDELRRRRDAEPAAPGRATEGGEARRLCLSVPRAAKASASPNGTPDFGRMTPAEKIAWHRARWDRILG